MPRHRKVAAKAHLKKAKHHKKHSKKHSKKTMVKA